MSQCVEALPSLPLLHDLLARFTSTHQPDDGHLATSRDLNAALHRKHRIQHIACGAAQRMLSCLTTATEETQAICLDLQFTFTEQSIEDAG